MKKLIGEQKMECECFTLRYLLFEECDDKNCNNVFFSLLVELYACKKSEFAEARDFTGNRTAAEHMLRALHSGKVTPISLPYIIEDYLAQI